MAIVIFYLRYMSARLENFSEEEKRKLVSILKRKLFPIGGIYVVVILFSIAFIVYFNYHSADYYFQDNTEVINIVFIIIAVISGRLLASEILNYRKETKSPVKRVVETKVLVTKDGEITLGNKSFEEDDFLFSANDFDSLQSGDNVRVEFSAKSDRLFSVKRI